MSFIIMLPLVGASIVAILPGRRKVEMRATSIVASTVVMLISLLQFWLLRTAGEFDFTENISWINSIGVNFSLGVDGMSSLLAASFSIVYFIGSIVSLGEVERKIKRYYILFPVAFSGTVAVFLTTNLIAFVLALEISIISYVFLIGLWGGTKRIAASLRFIVLAQLACAALFFCFVYCGAISGTFDVFSLYAYEIGMLDQKWMFVIIVIALFALSGIFPFGWWMKGLIEDAPRSVSMAIIAGFSSIGMYGIYRLAIPLFPIANTALSDAVMIYLCVVLILSASLMLAGRNFISVMASSVSALMAMIAIGLFSANIEAVSGALFMIGLYPIMMAGAFLYELYSSRKEHRSQLVAEGGFVEAPLMKTSFLVILLSFASFPMFGAFYGVFSVSCGVFQRDAFMALPVIACYVIFVIAIIRRGMIGGAMMRRHEMSAGEFLTMVPVAFIGIVLGVYPEIIAGKLMSPAAVFVELLKRYEILIPAGMMR